MNQQPPSEAELDAIITVELAWLRHVAAAYRAGTPVLDLCDRYGITRTELVTLVALIGARGH